MTQTEIRIEPVSHERYSHAFRDFSDATVYQTWQYADVVFPGQRSELAALTSGDETVALAQVRTVTLPGVGGVAYIAWGPLWRRTGRATTSDVFDRTMQVLRDEYAGKRRLVFRVTPNIKAEEVPNAVEILERLRFTRERDQGAYCTIVLDLTAPIESIRKAFAQKWRNGLNRSERNGLEIRSGRESGLYREFLSIYDEMMARKSFDTGVNARQWAFLQDALPPHEKLDVLLADKNGTCVAAMVFSCIGDTGIYILGATSDEGLSLKGSYLLQWHAIQMLKDAGCTAYDLGGIDPVGNPGVYHFKSGLGGREVSHIGTYEYCESTVSGTLVHLGKTARKLRSVLSRRAKGHG